MHQHYEVHMADNNYNIQCILFKNGDQEEAEENTESSCNPLICPVE